VGIGTNAVAEWVSFSFKLYLAAEKYIVRFIIGAKASSFQPSSFSTLPRQRNSRTTRYGIIRRRAYNIAYCIISGPASAMRQYSIV